MSVSLKSRIPEIVGEIPLSVGAAIHEGTAEIAKDAQDRASALYTTHTEERVFSIEAGTSGDKFGILASWFWFFGEFGTAHQAARPFMIPAAEEGKDRLAENVRAALEKL